MQNPSPHSLDILNEPLEMPAALDVEIKAKAKKIKTKVFPTIMLLVFN